MRRRSYYEARMKMKRKAYLERMAVAQPALKGKALQKFLEEDQDFINAEEKGKVKEYLNKYPERIEGVAQMMKGKNLSGVNFNQTDFSKFKIPNKDLSHTKFIEAEINKSNLAGFKLFRANFSEADLSDTILTGADLSGADLSLSCLTGTHFNNAVLLGADLTNADGLVTTDFTRANLLGVRFEDNELRSVIFTGVKEVASFKDATLISTHLKGMTITNQDGLHGTVFTNSSLEGITYIDGKFEAASNIKNTKLNGANLSGCEAIGVDFTSSEFNAAILDGANLSNCDFTDAKFLRASLEGADLSGADFDRADLSEAVLKGADLSGADLASARSLKGADLTGAILTGADLRSVNLEGANLTNATLYGADLTGVDLSRVNLKGIKKDRATKMDMSFGRSMKKLLLRRAAEENKLAQKVAARFERNLY